MKIEQLHLKAVGPFTDVTLDFRSGDKGLHLIYGPNEAGKSSALRAIHYLLFGFPTRLDDDFVHGYKELRVGADLSRDQGDALQVVRRKANRKSLRDGDDNRDIAESILQAFLGNADEELFRNSFGIDHQRLVEGGDAIVRGQGDLGQMLFSGAGVSDLRQLETQLNDELNEMFSPSSRASKPTINQQIRQLNECLDNVRKLQLRPAEWQRHHDARQQAIRRQEQVEAERDEKRVLRDRLERFRKALGKIPEYTERREELEQLRDVVSLSESFNRQREQVVPDLKVAESKCRNLQAEIDRIEQKRDAIKIPQALLDVGPRLDSLEKELHRFQDALTDRPIVVVKLKARESDALQVLGELGEDADLERATSLLLPAVERLRIQSLVTEYSGIRKAVADTAREVKGLEDKQRESAERLSRLPAPVDSGRLQQAVTAALKLGDIDDELDGMEQQLERESEQAAGELARLPGWNGALEQLESLVVPLAATVERFGDEFQSLASQRDTLEEQIRQTRQDMESHEARIAELSADRDVPTEAQLQTLRRDRDAAWRAVRAGPSDPAANGGNRPELSESLGRNGESLEETFERLLQAADELSDRLRHEADRVARHGHLQAELDRTRKRLDRTVEQRDALAAKREQVQAEWNAEWQRAGIDPKPPRDMRSWLQQFGALLERARKIREIQTERAAKSRLMSERKQRMVEEMRAAGRPPESADRRLGELLSEARDTLEGLDNIARERRDLDTEIGRLQEEHRRKQEEQTAAKARHDQWREEWKIAVASLPASSASKPGEANQALELLNQLSLKLNDINTQRQRLEEIDGSCGQFERKVRELAGLVTSDLPLDHPVEAVATEILARYRAARDQQKERRRLDGELRNRRETLQESSGELDALRSRQTELCREARCESPDDLLRAWEQSREKAAVQQRCEQLAAELRELAAGAGLAEFIEEALARDPDRLAVEIEQLDRETGELDRQLIDEIGQTIGREQEVLSRMDGSGKAAKEAEAARDILAGIAELAEEYAVLRLAHSALRRGIEHYREQHQDPILETAGRVFGRLTCGAFEGLKVDLDQDGQPVMLGVRAADGKTVGVAAMSDGTADQLYLALRYAWLARYLETHESLPFVVDDILIRFDDRRSCETMRILAELSRRTQVLFFTHHRHLVEHAEKLLPSEILFVHELSET